MSSPHDTATRASGRIDWVDAAKGMSILLVVVHHMVYLMEPHGLVPGPVSALNMALASLRMPLFFLASGLFAWAPLSASWRTLLHKRVAFFMYLFLLWTFLQGVTFWALPPAVAPPDAAKDWAELAWEAVLPGPAMWFLFALAVFSIVGKLLLRVPAWIQLAVSGVLCAAVGAGLLTFESFSWTFMARYLFFFLLGVHARWLVEALAERSGLLMVVGTGVACGGLAGISVLLDLRSVFGVAFVLNIAAVTFGVVLAAYLSRFRLFRPLVTLGANTLPVYLTNVIVVCGIVAVLRMIPMPAVAGWVTPVVLAVLVVGVTLAATWGLRWAGAYWLFALPDFLAYRPEPVPSPAPAAAPTPVTATGRHRLRTTGDDQPVGVPGLPGLEVLGGTATAPVFARSPWHARRPVPHPRRPQPRRSAFWDTDDWTASARPTTIIRPIRG